MEELDNTGVCVGDDSKLGIVAITDEEDCISDWLKEELVSAGDWVCVDDSKTEDDW